MSERTPGEYVLPPPVSINVIPILGFADASKKPSFAPMHRQVCHVSKRVRGLDFRQIERYPLRERTRQLCIDMSEESFAYLARENASLGRQRIGLQALYCGMEHPGVPSASELWRSNARRLDASCPFVRYDVASRNPDGMQELLRIFCRCAVAFEACVGLTNKLGADTLLRPPLLRPAGLARTEKRRPDRSQLYSVGSVSCASGLTCGGILPAASSRRRHYYDIRLVGMIRDEGSRVCNGYMTWSATYRNAPVRLEAFPMQDSVAHGSSFHSRAQARLEIMDEEKQPSFCLHLQDVKRCENLLGVILTQASLIAPAFVSSYMVIRGYPGPRNLSSHGFFRIPRTYMHL
ncbi:hypothetical protein POSPLADRAFT_1032151 [Postia placenta MAD-698-R-SB12]|uniref:Uncharacterized protein n=1 Tax=Postia placenta MAD-698-R-SB12 TaxID=670580 RepID=A0A1X6N9P1_9APHY|nr:hypothetical protein POSPLADRAFT_1032151 [Postia placenta MAD-698-R-SB12]OSX65369.1 hypothetical protein POSPLADRAFT_1032151 [Postia placenta MAD-698-R-SB12]